MPGRIHSSRLARIGILAFEGLGRFVFPPTPTHTRRFPPIEREWIGWWPDLFQRHRRPCHYPVALRACTNPNVVTCPTSKGPIKGTGLETISVAVGFHILCLRADPRASVRLPDTVPWPIRSRALDGLSMNLREASCDVFFPHRVSISRSAFHTAICRSK